MTVVFMESFNLYNNVTGGASGLQAGGWSCGYPFDSAIGVNGRYGNRVLYKPATGGREDWYCAFPTAVSTFTIGFDLYTAQNIYVMNLTGAANHLSIVRGPNGEVDIRRGEGGATLLVTPAGSIPDNTWTYVEVGAVIDDTVGELKVWCDGFLVGEVSGIDTRNGGASPTWNTIQVVESGNKYLGNIYVKDEMGPPWGPLRIDVLLPTGDDATSGFIPLSGATLWEMIDEVATDGDTTYVSASAVNDQFTVAYGDLASVGDIRAVQVRPSIRKTDATARSTRAVIKDGSNTKTGSADFSLATGFSFALGGIFATDASDNPWTLAAVNDLRAGVKVTV